jgi:hypothetical protein
MSGSFGRSSLSERVSVLLKSCLHDGRCDQSLESRLVLGDCGDRESVRIGYGCSFGADPGLRTATCDERRSSDGSCRLAPRRTRASRPTSTFRLLRGLRPRTVDRQVVDPGAGRQVSRHDQRRDTTRSESDCVLVEPRLHLHCQCPASRHPRRLSSSLELVSPASRKYGVTSQKRNSSRVNRPARTVVGDAPRATARAGSAELYSHRRDPR